MITTSCFSAEARDYVGKIDNKIALIDGQKLAELMIDHESSSRWSSRTNGVSLAMV